MALSWSSKAPGQRTHFRGAWHGTAAETCQEPWMPRAARRGTSPIWKWGEPHLAERVSGLEVDGIATLELPTTSNYHVEMLMIGWPEVEKQQHESWRG